MLKVKDIVYNEGGKLEAFLLGYIMICPEIKGNEDLYIGYIKEYIMTKICEEDIEWVEDSGEFELAYKGLEEIGPDFELYVEIREENRLDSLED